MEAEVLLSGSQEPVTNPLPVPDESNPQHPTPVLYDPL